MLPFVLRNEYNKNLPPLPTSYPHPQENVAGHKGERCVLEEEDDVMPPSDEVYCCTLHPAPLSFSSFFLNISIVGIVSVDCMGTASCSVERYMLLGGA